MLLLSSTSQKLYSVDSLCVKNSSGTPVRYVEIAAMLGLSNTRVAGISDTSNLAWREFLSSTAPRESSPASMRGCRRSGIDPVTLWTIDETAASTSARDGPATATYMGKLHRNQYLKKGGSGHSICEPTMPQQWRIFINQKHNLHGNMLYRCWRSESDHQAYQEIRSRCVLSGLIDCGTLMLFLADSCTISYLILTSLLTQREAWYANQLKRRPHV